MNNSARLLWHQKCSVRDGLWSLSENCWRAPQGLETFDEAFPGCLPHFCHNG